MQLRKWPRRLPEQRRRPGQSVAPAPALLDAVSFDPPVLAAPALEEPVLVDVASEGLLSDELLGGPLLDDRELPPRLSFL